VISHSGSAPRLRRKHFATSTDYLVEDEGLRALAKLIPTLNGISFALDVVPFF
jgi:hypothetical protein